MSALPLNDMNEAHEKLFAMLDVLFCAVANGSDISAVVTARLLGMMYEESKTIGRLLEGFDWEASPKSEFVPKRGAK